MRKFRIKEVSYNNGETKYFIQGKYFKFFWMNCQMIKVHLYKSEYYIGEIGEELPLSTENFLQAKNIKHWLEINKDNCIGYNNEDDIIYLHWSEKESEPFLPKYIGSAFYAYALESLKDYIEPKIEKIKRIKKVYHY